MLRCASFLLVSGLLLLSFGACQSNKLNPALYPPIFPTKAEADIWQAGESPVALQIDGSLEEVWRSVAPRTVFLKRAIDGSAAFPVILRAMWHEDTVYISAQWPDDKADTMPNRYVWNENSGLYESTTTAEDMFSIEFEMEGTLLETMFTTATYKADVWQWKAGRGNSIGFADDKYHIVSGTEPIGVNSERFDLYDGTQCWIARPGDMGSEPYRRAEPPKTFTTPFVPAYESIAPKGSRGDVIAKGSYDGTYWTLEMSRKMTTGNLDDVRFERGRDLPCAIAVFNASRDLGHVVSSVMHLRLRVEPRN